MGQLPAIGRLTLLLQFRHLKHQIKLACLKGLAHCLLRCCQPLCWSFSLRFQVWIVQAARPSPFAQVRPPVCRTRPAQLFLFCPDRPKIAAKSKFALGCSFWASYVSLLREELCCNHSRPRTTQVAWYIPYFPRPSWWYRVPLLL